MAMTMTVSAAAIEARVRRHYAAEASVLRKSRTVEERRACGTWFVVNSNNYVCAGFDDIEVHARDLGVVQPWESVN